MKSISPYDIIPNNTVVRINGIYKGIIQNHEIASNNVIIHTVKIEQKLDTTIRPMYWKPVKTPYIWQGSYRFIEIPT
jgi:hypothetical protein